jgi:peptidyl-prolyl cis-trans isomerase B (cyclophilin B)
MLLYLYDATPQHKNNFFKLTKEGYFDGTTFHRIIPNFVIQGGDPNSKDNDATNDGEGGPNYQIPAEIKDGIVHKYGAVGAARDNNPQKASNGSQFYIVVNKNGVPHLNGGYTVFGEVVDGMDVAEKIAAQQRDSRDRPVANIPMTVTIVKMKLKKLTKLLEAKNEKLQAK